jgi:hypothetical protein
MTRQTPELRASDLGRRRSTRALRRLWAGHSTEARTLQSADAASRSARGVVACVANVIRVKYLCNRTSALRQAGGGKHCVHASEPTAGWRQEREHAQPLGNALTIDGAKWPASRAKLML